jgi:hypothetical protein
MNDHAEHVDRTNIHDRCEFRSISSTRVRRLSGYPIVTDGVLRQIDRRDALDS